MSHDRRPVAPAELFDTVIRLWAAATLFSLFSSFPWVTMPDTEYGITGFLAFMTASWVTFRRPTPTSALLFMLCFIVHAWLELPGLPNHRHLMVLFDLLLSFGIIRDLLRKRPPGTCLLGRARSFARGLVITLYGYAFLAKLNTAYLDPMSSCSVVFYEHMKLILPILPGGRLIDHLMIYSSLVIEGLLPVLLFTRRFRMWGVLLGLIFHFVLSWDLAMYFANFSGVMSVLLILFLPDDFFTFFRTQGQTLLRTPLAKRAAFGLSIRPFPWCAFVIYGIATITGILEFTDIFTFSRWLPLWELARHLLWLVFIIPLIAVTFRYAANHYPSEEFDARRDPSLPVFESLVLLLAILNGAAPYIGAKTRTSFNMYSNVRIDPDYSNHLFVSGSLDLFGYLSDTGRIESDQDYVCGYGLQSGVSYPYIEIARKSLECPNEELEVLRGDRRLRWTAADRPAISRELTWLERKIFSFRPIDRTAETGCFW